MYIIYKEVMFMYKDDKISTNVYKVKEVDVYV